MIVIFSCNVNKYKGDYCTLFTNIKFILTHYFFRFEVNNSSERLDNNIERMIKIFKFFQRDLEFSLTS